MSVKQIGIIKLVYDFCKYYANAHLLFLIGHPLRTPFQI